VDQTAGHMEAETQKPQNQKHNENRPKHVYLLRSFVESLVIPASHLSAPVELLGTTSRTPNKMASIVE
jgi:hypothetical protein